MECPRCRKDTLSSDGICPACNYKVTPMDRSIESEFNGEKARNASQSAEEGISVDKPSPGAREELPPWRKELAQRLTDIKQKKEVDENPVRSQSPDFAPTLPASPEPPKRQSLPKVAQAGFSAPLQKTIASLGPEVYTADKPARNPDSRHIEDLIDRTVSHKSVQTGREIPVFIKESAVAGENKLILLSRTLAGLIDLIIVVLCTVVFIISADYFSGIVILDAISIIEYAGLFLLVFLLYSIFFLATSGQTVGMMITDLRIVGIHGGRPSIGQLFSRCFCYMLSVIVIGAGLLWSLFDRDNLCFHDRISNTSITRL